MKLDDDNKTLPPFFRIDSMQPGETAIIVNDMKPNPRFGTPQCDIETIGGSIFTTAFNGTSLRACSAVWGPETKDWVGKKVVYSIEDVNSKQYGLKKDCRIFRPAKDE